MKSVSAIVGASVGLSSSRVVSISKTVRALLQVQGSWSSRGGLEQRIEKGEIFLTRNTDKTETRHTEETRRQETQKRHREETH